MSHIGKYHMAEKAKLTEAYEGIINSDSKNANVAFVFHCSLSASCQSSICP